MKIKSGYIEKYGGYQSLNVVLHFNKEGQESQMTLETPVVYSDSEGVTKLEGLLKSAVEKGATVD